jgi:hypothetical protein
MAKDRANTAIYVAFEDHQGIDPAEPERNLLRAIMLTALSDLRKEGESRKKAIEYFLNPEDEYLFSFQSVCTLLDIDPKQILVVAGLTPPARDRVHTADSVHPNKLDGDSARAPSKAIQ